MLDENLTSMTLLNQIRSGDQIAWHRLNRIYRPLIVYWCRKGGATRVADDLAQEVLLAVSVGIIRFDKRAPGDSFRGWLRGVTRNKLLQWHRRQGREVGVGVGGSEADQALGNQPDPFALPDEEDGAERQEVQAMYLRALELVRHEFEERTWQTFWRVTVDGMASADVARSLGVTPAAVRLAKSRVLHRLKAVVGDLAD